MSWYRTGTVAVTNGSKTVTGVGTLFTTAVNVGDAFALVDANLNPTGAWYEVEAVVSNAEITLKQSYAGTTGSNNQYCVFNMVGNMTTPSFAQRLATFFASFQSLIDKPTTTPTAASIPVADANGDIDSGWLKDASTTVKGVVELATSAETTTATDTTRAVTPAGFLAGLRGNLLGTVSQSGGIPTGAVIERGSNANGEYVKFADGTMICSIRKAITDQAINTSTGSLYFGTWVWFFPVSFQEPPVVATSMARWGTGVSWGTTFDSSKASADLICFDTISRSAGTTFTYAVTAIGRWY